MLLRWWIFEGMAIISSAQTFTTLVSFNYTDGASPDYMSLVQGTDGNHYGTASNGGAGDSGTVYKITPGGTLTTLYSFSGGADGGGPTAGLIQAADGNFYGTTIGGGTNNFGTVFKITPGGTPTTLYRFTGVADGLKPRAPLIQATDGNFYGTTEGGAPEPAARSSRSRQEER